MKALIISDVHSNIFALEAIWSNEQDSDLIYCTGDLVDYGPFPREVLEWVRGHNVICTQGNHDRWVASCYRAGNMLPTVPAAERAWAHHNAALLADDDILYLEQLPLAVRFELDGTSYGMTHLYQKYGEIVSIHGYKQFRAGTFSAPATEPLSRLIFGHTHRQALRYLSDEMLWLNPGSASYRRMDDPDQSAHYATIIDGVLSLKRLVYDIEPLRHAVEQVTLMESEMRIARRCFGAR